MNIDLSTFINDIIKINTILLPYFKKHFKKQFRNSHTFIQFLLYLSKDSDFHKHLLIDLFYLYYYKSSKFNKSFHFEIIQIIGNSVEDCDDILYNSRLNGYIFGSIKKCHYKKLSYFLPFLNNFHNEENNILLPKYDFIMIKYVTYITKLDNVQETIKWLNIIKKLINKHNIIYFFKHSGFEQLDEIQNKYPHNLIIMSQIAILKLKTTNYSFHNTTSLHQLCKYHNSLSSTRFMLQNTEIDYNKKNCVGKTPIHIAILKSNKSIIELLISCGVRLDIQCKNKTIINLIHEHLPIYHKTDPFFVNTIQSAFIKRSLNNKLINETIQLFPFYEDINSIIKLYVDPVSEYFKNEARIEHIMKSK